MDDVTLARYALLAVAAAAVAYGLYRFLKREPPTRRMAPVLAPDDR